MRVPSCLLVLASIVATLAFPALARAECTKQLVMRPGPEEYALPALVVECDEAETPLLLEDDATAALCADVSDSERAACEQAVESAEAALRKARIRAALRRGEEAEAVAERYDATEAELDALAPVGPPPPAATKLVEQEE